MSSSQSEKDNRESVDNSVEQESEHQKVPPIKIVLHGSQDNRTIFLARPNTKISKLLGAFCKERAVDPKEYRMVYKGKVLLEGEQVSTYGIKDGSVIEVIASQTGGKMFC